ncbi:integral membrane protein 2B-like [Saccoglossus kowalevskii]|uniref:Integral membrane protein 2 n=1 Tax=Saccoglossus kowalevskii TaxID=10224 RepID=A0ABM0GUN8_SACKO|nr:PREDICTED: integral membrane protein 2B-like [Saccoglossus kowalevskii]
MTIYTTEVKKKDSDDVPEVKAVLIVDAEKAEEVAAPPPPRPRRRSGFCTTCVVCVLACLMVAGGVIGGMFLFKHFTRGKFIGRCGVNYKNHELMIDDAIAIPQYESYSLGPTYDMDEDVEIDSSELTETITVPSFDDNHPATILHDFTSKLSAYKDLQERYCYVMELNTSAILPPRNFIDLLLKVRDGSYIPKADVVKRTMVVLEPEVKDLDQFGPFISYLCSDVPTYRLVKITDLIGGGLIEKRSIDGKDELGSKDELNCKNTAKIGYFSGKFLIEDSVCWQ